VILAVYECTRGSIAAPRPGLPISVPSVRASGPAQARKTVSRMDGVKRDSVRCDSARAARRRRFFCEKEAYVSVDEASIAKGEPSAVVPRGSTGSCGDDDKGSIRAVELSAASCLSVPWYSGTNI
jgi:hypothetical protein